MKLRKELLELETDLKIKEFEKCTSEEVKEYKKLIKEKKKIPDGIFQDGNGWFYRALESELSEKEIEMVLRYRQTDYLRAIRNIMIYFAFLASIALFFAFINFINIIY